MASGNDTYNQSELEDKTKSSCIIKTSCCIVECNWNMCFTWHSMCSPPLTHLHVVSHTQTHIGTHIHTYTHTHTHTHTRTHTHSERHTETHRHTHTHTHTHTHRDT